MSQKIEGTVTTIGDRGNLITNICVDQLTDPPKDATTSIRFGGHETNGIYENGHKEPEATMVAYLGDSGFLEIEIVGMNLAEMLGIPIGAKVSVVW